ncbi:flagellin N-terminal helical domain-containing protein [Dethiobacter alkaliphilus]|uniref:flagellin N-terminal helical domain-containing protein n=1 Tax=Dethiobacter alkaliphilus TaxID=427926 RepID=UPI002227155C|nr:flagellin [Dethiobacter alkaliphilus]MCW3488761.1 flagellin [Dethiobacter alkaliphilus]
MRINTNVSAMNAHRQLGINTNNGARSMERLSSGLRINRAGDDAAGLAISEKMRGQIRGLNQATRNAQDGISVIQTAEGALTETHAILQRVRELAVQAANDTNTDVDRAEIQKEVDQLLLEVDRIANTTEFNQKKLLNGELMSTSEVEESVAFDNHAAVFSNIVIATDGTSEDATYNVKITGVASRDGDGNPATYTVEWSDHTGTPGTDTVAVAGGDITIGAFTLSIGSLEIGNVGDEATFSARQTATEDPSAALSFQIGANSSQTINVGVSQMDSEALFVKGLNVETAQSAGAAISAVNMAIEDVSAERSKLGAVQNRLEHTIANLGVASENLSAAESRIRDVDMASEMMEFTKSNILNQAATAMLAQANMAPQSVLQLLG